jgi:microsomal dipeptidase-like Zn-dependent dipeptidase
MMRALALAFFALALALLMGCPPKKSPERHVRRTSSKATPRPLGFADLHNHQFNHLASGHMIWGAASGDPETALEPCSAAATGAKHGHGPLGLEDALERYHPARCGAYGGHLVGGWPQHDGWPRWDTFTHQQVYETWLRRAHIGGLRLMVMVAGNAKSLCDIPGVADCKDDMDVVLEQIRAAKMFERTIDALAACNGPCASPPFNDECDVAVEPCTAEYYRDRPGWYRIVYTAEQARETIEAGKLAVVLGMEVPDPFGCKEKKNCTAESVREDVKEMRRIGLRHMFVVHQEQNAFAGAGIFMGGQCMLCGPGPDVCLDVGPDRDCSDEGYKYERRCAGGDITRGPACGFSTGSVRCSSQALTPLGKALVTTLMDQHMLIDVDHMSARARAETFALSRKRTAGPYPLISGHTDLMDISVGDGKNEAALKVEELEGVRNSTGLIAPIINPGTLEKVCGERPLGGADCGEPNLQTSCAPNDWGSSAEWARAYLFAKRIAQGPVALGSDFNGLVLLPRPRFGAEGCGTLPHDASQGATSYPFQLHPGLPSANAPECGAGKTDNCACLKPDGRMDRCVFGDKKFDVKEDGLPHVGLLPDFIEDARAQFAARYRSIGLSDIEAEDLATSDIDPLFRSADAFVLMWERAEGNEPPADPDAHEPNDTFDTASDGDLIPPEAELDLHNANDIDYFTFDPAPCSQVVITIRYAPPDGLAPDVTVLDAQGNAIAATRVDNHGQIQLTLRRQRGRFTLKIEHPTFLVCRNSFDCRNETHEFVGSYSFSIARTPEPNVGPEVCDGIDNDCNGIVDDCAGPECVDVDMDRQMNCVDPDDDGDCIVDDNDNCRTTINGNYQCPQASPDVPCFRCTPPNLTGQVKIIEGWLKACAFKPVDPKCLRMPCGFDSVFGRDGATLVAQLSRSETLNGTMNATLTTLGVGVDSVTLPSPSPALNIMPIECGWGPSIEGAGRAIQFADAQYKKCVADAAAQVAQGFCQADANQDGVGDVCQ